MDWISTRMREPSTWGGLISLVSVALHVTIPAGTAQAITALGVALGGVISVLTEERRR